MDEHERNLLDLYAGLAMLGWIVNGDYSKEAIPDMALDMAKEMIKLRRQTTDERVECTRCGKFIERDR